MGGGRARNETVIPTTDGAAGGAPCGDKAAFN